MNAPAEEVNKRVWKRVYKNDLLNRVMMKPTVYVFLFDDFIDWEVAYVPAVQSGKEVTASGTSAVEFAKEIFSLTRAYTEEEIEEWYLLYRM